MNQPFAMKYVGQEEHLMAPPISKLFLAQSLYEVLFQYILDADMEEKLQAFTKKVEAHLDTKTFRKTPFSVPMEEVAFLDEGLSELKLLMWQKIPVFIFEVDIPVALDNPAYEAAKEAVERVFNELFVYVWRGEKEILVYPGSAV